MEAPRNYGQRHRKLIYAAAALFMGATAAQATVTLVDRGGWEFSTDGRVGGYLTHTSGEAAPSSVTGTNGVVFSQKAGVEPHTFSGGEIGNAKISESRVRTGFTPPGFGVNVIAPEVNGWTPKARLGIYSSIQAGNSKGATGSNLDWREAYVDMMHDRIGTFRVGRSMGLFQRQHLLSDYEAHGVGTFGAGGDGGTSGRAGFGYLHPNFNAQITYHSPNLNGFNFAIGLFDPSDINGEIVSRATPGPAAYTAGDVGNRPTASATITNTPRLEWEITYDWDFTSSDSVKLFLSALWQKARFDDRRRALYPTIISSWPSGTGGGGGIGHDGVRSRGLGYGFNYQGSMFEVVATAYHGHGLGTYNMLSDGNALDEAGTARRNNGWYLQGRVSATDCLKVGAAWGQSKQKKSAFDEANLLTTGAVANRGNYLDKQRNWNISLFYDLNKWTVFNAGFTKSTTKYFAGEKQENKTVSAGLMFNW